MRHTKKLLVFMFITIVLIGWIELVEGQKKVDIILKKMVNYDQKISAVGDGVVVLEEKERAGGKYIKNYIVLENSPGVALRRITPADMRNPNRKKEMNELSGWKVNSTIHYIKFSENQKYIGISGYVFYEKEGETEKIDMLFCLMDNSGNILYQKELWTKENETFYISNLGEMVAMSSSIGLGWDGSFYLYDIKGNMIKKIQVLNRVSAGPPKATFSDNGNYILLSEPGGLSANNRTYLILYDRNGNELWRKEGHGCEYGMHSFISPNAQYILSHGAPESNIEKSTPFIEGDYIEMYDILGNRLWRNSIGGGNLQAKFTDDDKYVVISSTESWISMLESQTGNTLWEYRELGEETRKSFENLDISSDGELIITVGPINEYLSTVPPGIYDEGSTKAPSYIRIFDKNGLICKKEYIGQRLQGYIERTTPCVKINPDKKTIRIDFEKSIGYFEIVQ